MLCLTASAEPALRVTCTLSETLFVSGDELRPEVWLHNDSERPITLQIMKPWRLVPELLDDKGRRLPNAPSVIIDQIVVPESIRLEPRGSYQVGVIPVCVDVQRERGQAALWSQARPGPYRVRFTLQLRECIPGATGSLTSNELPILVGRRHTGKLEFRPGAGYFLVLPSGRRLKLLVSENKILVASLQERLGENVTVRGMPVGEALELSGTSLEP